MHVDQDEEETRKEMQAERSVARREAGLRACVPLPASG